MVTRDSHSRVTAWLKILLPLMALAILSTVFLIARAVDPARELDYADVDGGKPADRRMIVNPRYFGVTGDGVAVTLAAESASTEMARQDSASPDRLRSREVHAEIDIPDGDRIDVYASGLDLDIPENQATFDGDVRIESSNDYTLRAHAVRLALDAGLMSSDTETMFSAPFGHIVADSFRMSDKGKDPHDYVLVFEGGVRMLFNPGKRGVP